MNGSRDTLGQGVRRLTLVATVGATLLAASVSTASAQVSLVSETATAIRGDGASTEVSVSEDGRYVAFTSDATNLVPGDTNGVSDVFVKDRVTGTVTRVSVGTGGVQATARSWGPVISATGRYVAFATEAALQPLSDIAPCEPTESCVDTYLHDMQTGTTRMASNWPVRLDVRPVGVSADGSKVLARGRLWPAVPPPGRLVDLYLFKFGPDAGSVVSQPFAEPGIALHTSGRAGLDAAGTTAMFSADRSLLPEDDALPCAAAGCQRLYAYDVDTRTFIRVTPALPALSNADSIDLTFLDMSSDGRFVLFMVASQGPSPIYGAHLLDRATGRVRRVDYFAAPERIGAVSDDGHTVVTCAPSAAVSHAMAVFDHLRPEPRPDQPATASCATSVAVSGNGRVVAFDSTASDVVPGDGNGVADVFAYDRDPDGDGMPTTWEVFYGFNPQDPADAASDADGDGRSNADEFRADSHPKGAVTRYFPEGASNAFFDTSLYLFNPGTSPAAAHLTFVGQNGQQTISAVKLGAGEARTLSPQSEVSGAEAIATPDAAFSTIIESDQPLVAERDMSWGSGAAYGSHAETASVEPRTEWHFAEGATGRYSLYYLLQNPGATPAQVTVTYLLPSPDAPIARTYTVEPHSRRTIDVNSEPGLPSGEMSARLTSDVPILAERAMYISRPNQLFAGGHEGAAVPAPATEWFVAEGATGFFSLYLTVENPGTTDAEIEVTYLRESGDPVVRRHTAPKEGRLTIDVASEDARLVTATIGAIVRSTNDVPVVVERVMWWPRNDPYEASLTAGSLTTGRRWAVAGARDLPEEGVETYLLIASPTGEAGTVTIKLSSHLPSSTVVTCEITRPVLARTRLTVPVREVCDGQLRPDTALAGTVESTTPIVVERATYVSTAGVFWSGGSAATLTKLPDVP